jgi:hypothetical protein
MKLLKKKTSFIKKTKGNKLGVTMVNLTNLVPGI